MRSAVIVVLGTTAAALAQGDPRVTPPGPQVRSPASAEVGQLSSPGGGDAPEQIAGAVRVDASDPSISRADRIVAAPVVVGGSDRCRSPDAQSDPVCVNAIEGRAAEFARPDPNRLTPEQRILVGRRITDRPASVDETVRRIGREDVDPDTQAAQTLASLTQSSPDRGAPPDGKPATDLPSDLGEALEAAIVGAGGQVQVQGPR